MQIRSEDGLIWCCQGAEECDGIRWNAEARQFEFVLYLNKSGPVWHKAVACPLCGEQFTYVIGIRDAAHRAAATSF